MSPSNAVVVIGAEGRIGHLLCGMTRGPWQPVGVTRTSDPARLSTALADGEPPAPIVVCTRNDSLDAVVDFVHPSRWSDLVFIQNGAVRPWLVARGLEGKPSALQPRGEPDRGVLWVAVPKKGDMPVPGGASVFSGKWAATLADMLNAHGVDARSVSRVELAREEAVKVAWICATGVLGSATGLGVGGIDTHHSDDLESVVRELHPVLCISPGLDIDEDALVARVRAYSARIPHFPARLKEWTWRNGAVLQTAESAGLTTPLHDKWLARAGGPPS